MSLSLAWPQPKNISPPRFKFSDKNKDKDNDNDKNKTSLKEPRSLSLDHNSSDEKTWEDQPNDKENIDDKV